MHVQFAQFEPFLVLELRQAVIRYVVCCTNPDALYTKYGSKQSSMGETSKERIVMG